MNKTIQFAIIILFALAQMFPLYSEYTISSATISNGGILNSSDGATTTLSSTIGETAIGNSEDSTGDIQLFAGFWNTYLITGTLGSPQNVVSSVSGITLTLDWDVVTGASSYDVYSSTNPYIGFILEEENVLTNTWDTSVDTQNKYFYYIVAKNTAK